MGNCLVTKLKEQVQNENLITMSGVSFIVKSVENGSSNAQLIKVGILGGTVRVTGNGRISDDYSTVETTSNKTYEVNLGNQTLYLKNTDCNFIVENKYMLRRLETKAGYDSVLHVNLEDLKYNTALTIITLNSYCIGNINTLSNKIGLTAINLTDTEVVGTIEDLCEGFVRNGKTSDVSLTILRTSVTFNGQALSASIYVSFATNSCTIKDVSDNVLATYNGSSWTYNS